MGIDGGVGGHAWELRQIRLVVQRQQSRDKIKELFGDDLVFAEGTHLQTRVGQLYEGGGGHTREMVVVQLIGKHLAQGGLPGLYSGAARVASERGLHSSRIVWCKWLLIDRLPYCNRNGSLVLFGLLEQVGPARAFLGEAWLETLLETGADGSQLVFEEVVDGEGSEDCNGRVCDRLHGVIFIRSRVGEVSGRQNYIKLSFLREDGTAPWN